MQNIQIVKGTQILSRSFDIHIARIGNQSVYAYEFKNNPIPIDYIECPSIRKFLQKVDEYFVFDYRKGLLLSSLVNCSSNLIANIITQVLLTLFQIWKQGFFGRVFNVDNILLLEDGQILFMDFGSEGCLPYTPPEIQLQQNFSNRTDIYLVGRILFYLLTGRSISNLRQYSDVEINVLLQKTNHPRSMLNLCVALLQYDVNTRPLIVEALGILNFSDQYILNEIRQYEQKLQTNHHQSQIMESTSKFIVNFLEISDLSTYHTIKDIEVQETIKRCEQVAKLDQRIQSNSFNFSDYVPPMLDIVEYHMKLYNSRFEMMRHTCKLIYEFDQVKHSQFTSTSVFCIEKMRLIQMNTQIKELQEKENILSIDQVLWNQFTESNQFAEELKNLQRTLLSDSKQLKQFSQDIQGVQKDDFLTQLQVDVTFQNVKLSYRFYLRQITDEVINRKSKLNDKALEVLYLYLILCSAINSAYVPCIQTKIWKVIFDKLQSYDLVQYIKISDIEEIRALSQLFREMYFGVKQI